MRQPTFNNKKWWIDRFENNRGYYEDAVEILRDWEASSQSEHLFINALRAAYADAAPSIVHKFASAAGMIVDRAVADNAFEQGKVAQRAFPRNRAVALRARAYAKVLLGEPLSANDLVQASHDFESIATSIWNHQYEAYYLNGVRAAFIAGDHARFRSLLNTKREFKWHEEEYGVLRGIADELSSVSSAPRTDLRDRFRALFDLYRNPEFKPDIYMELEIVRFELGAIWCQLFDKTPTFAWQEVIDAVSA